MLQLLGKAQLLGLSTGLFCAGFCLPIAGPALLGRERHGFRDSAGALGLFLAGRLAGYLLFGLVFGLLGAALARVGQVRTVVLPIVYLLLGLMLVLYGFVLSFPHIGLCRVLGPKLQSRWYLLVAGFLAGINLCPPFLLAVTAAVDAGTPWKGLVFFMAFFVATSVYLAPLLLAGVAARFQSVRFAGRVASALAGLWFVYLGIAALARRP
jgi:sulfite exporter TauE/SafE